MSIHNIELEEWENKCFQYLMTSEDIDPWLSNFAKERARKASIEILSALMDHCNENDIALAVGKAAQITQAFELGVVRTAAQRNADSITP